MSCDENPVDLLRERWRDVAYIFAKELGMIWLVRRLGGTPKQWVREREIRELHARRR